MKFLQTFLCSIIIFSSISCTNLLTTAITEEKGAIPPAFGKSNNTLLCVMRGQNKYDKNLLEAVGSEYTGDHVFVYKNELNDYKYSDIDKYRFIFDMRYIASEVQDFDYNYASREFDGGTREASMGVYFVYDRKEKTTYSSYIGSGSVRKILGIYMQQLEQKRKKS